MNTHITMEPNTTNIILKDITEGKLSLNVNGEVREIQNQLAELKSLLQNQKVQNVQYADKIYNIEHINEANFGFITGKKAFNETLTKQLIETIKADSIAAQRFLEKVAGIPNWENQLRISDKAKEIIAYSFVGVIGIQFSKLMAIGKEDFSEAKQRKYIEKCLHIVKRSLDLVAFTLISKCWDRQKQQAFQLSEAHKTVLANRFNNSFELSILEQFRLLQVLWEIFESNENTLILPMQELKNIATQLKEGSALQQICQRLQTLDDKLDKAQYDLLDCFEAESQLADFFNHFYFLVNYRMASIKQIGYRQSRNADPRYLHRYAALGIDSKANVDAEKINYTAETVHTDAVLLYRGDNYQENTNLFPFVIDFNALSFEHGSKICFYRAQDLNDGNLEYLFLEDNSIVYLERKGIIKPDTDYNELMLSNDNQKTVNMDSVIDQFRAARTCLIGEEINFDDL
jgi:hypothetical protein